MPRFGLVGPSYEAQSPNLDAQICINFYVEQDESGAGNAPIALLSTPGIQTFVNLTQSQEKSGTVATTEDSSCAPDETPWENPANAISGVPGTDASVKLNE